MKRYSERRSPLDSFGDLIRRSCLELQDLRLCCYLCMCTWLGKWFAVFAVMVESQWILRTLPFGAVVPVDSRGIGRDWTFVPRVGKLRANLQQRSVEGNAGTKATQRSKASRGMGIGEVKPGKISPQDFSGRKDPLHPLSLAFPEEQRDAVTTTEREKDLDLATFKSVIPQLPSSTHLHLTLHLPSSSSLSLSLIF